MSTAAFEQRRVAVLVKGVGDYVAAHRFPCSEQPGDRCRSRERLQQYDARNIGGGLNWRSSLPLLATRDESLSPEEFSPRQFDSKPPQAGLAILEAAGRFPAHAGYWICLSRAMNDIYLRPARKVFG